jgi:hypothetical protein
MSTFNLQNSKNDGDEVNQSTGIFELKNDIAIFLSM